VRTQKNKKFRISYAEGTGYFLSEAFAGKEIAVRKSHIQGCYSLFFRQFRIGRIDTEKRVFTFKRAYLIDGDPRLRGGEARREY
jgi:hypothetical protein